MTLLKQQNNLGFTMMVKLGRNVGIKWVKIFQEVTRLPEGQIY
jgi:hypothetical protein